jgi:hypothetical protein
MEFFCNTNVGELPMDAAIPAKITKLMAVIIPNPIITPKIEAASILKKSFIVY